VTDTLEFAYAIEPLEQARVSTLVAKRARGARLWRWVSIPLVAIPFGLALVLERPLSVLGPYLGVLAFAGILALAVPVLRRRQAARILADMPQLRNLTYRFSPQGIHLSTAVTSANLKWDGIHEAIETDDMFLLFMGRHFAYYVPKRVVGSSAAELRGLLHQQLGARAAGVGQPSLPVRPNER
jgi:hypothetical protein